MGGAGWAGRPLTGSLSAPGAGLGGDVPGWGRGQGKYVASWDADGGVAKEKVGPCSECVGQEGEGRAELGRL